MATTQAQRASLFTTLAELMGTEDAETLMQELPPSGWDNMATKDDLKVLAATVTAALAEFRVEVTNALAEIRVAHAESHAELVEGHAESHAEIVKSQARNLYITVSTIVLATIFIWIALLAGPTP